MPDLSHILPKLVLASQSVARKAILTQLGIEVQVKSTGCDESHSLSDPGQTVTMLSNRKLEAYRTMHPIYELPVLCCDTLIFFEQQLIGKPADRSEAYTQLASFSGKVQEVYSGWALWYENRVYSSSDKALVHFKVLDHETIEAYLDTLEWQGAAGAYRIQGKGRDLIASIEGDEATVIGLPLLQISEILTAPLSV